jgi:hypothetical protein
VTNDTAVPLPQGEGTRSARRNRSRCDTDRRQKRLKGPERLHGELAPALASSTTFVATSWSPCRRSRMDLACCSIAKQTTPKSEEPSHDEWILHELRRSVIPGFSSAPWQNRHAASHRPGTPTRCWAATASVLRHQQQWRTKKIVENSESFIADCNRSAGSCNLLMARPGGTRQPLEITL